jgi:hypothetical protein
MFLVICNIFKGIIKVDLQYYLLPTSLKCFGARLLSTICCRVEYGAEFPISIPCNATDATDACDVDVDVDVEIILKLRQISSSGCYYVM